MNKEIDGVPNDFIENIFFYQNYFLDHFDSLSLDFTLESTEKLDDFLKDEVEREKIAQDSNLFFGFFAYCGKVIINEIESGNWALYSYDEETNKPRYYPYIKGREKHYEFYGGVEVFIERGKPNLVWRLKQAINPVKLNVVPVKDWYFPPLRENK